MAQPESDPPLCTLQPGGARVSSGDTPGGHLLPPSQPAAPSLAALGRRSQGKLPPGSALHSPASGCVLNKSQRTCKEEHCGQSKEEQGPWGGRKRDGPKQRRKGARDSKGRKRRGTVKNICTGSREAGSWPGGAGPGTQPVLPSLAQPPVWCSCLTHGPTMRSVLPWGCGKINGVQDKRSKKLFVLLS